MKEAKHKRLLVLLLCITMVGTMLLSACSQPEEEEEPPAPPSNALTGETEEDGYDTAAEDKRIVAFVVENSPDARPQWGLDDENYSPDIVLQAEVEGGITRTLWFYADYDKVPEIIGPTRSARPPFIRFSELFDSVFIHWGMSHSKGDYVGANTVFRKDKVDHINQMTLDDQEGMYDRDQTRATAIEHRGIIHGDKVPATMKNEGIRTTPEEYTQLYFNTTNVPLSDQSATNVNVQYSSRAFEGTAWKYDPDDGKYHTSSFENDFARDNLLVLYDDTEYITKENYQGGGGGSVTYCDYDFDGGRAQLFSQGTVKDISWERKDGKLILKDPDTVIATEEDLEKINEQNKALWKAKKAAEEAGEEFTAAEMEDGTQVVNKTYVMMPEAEEGEEEQAFEDIVDDIYVAQPLNKGKTWIGWISQNNGGSVSVS